MSPGAQSSRFSELGLLTFMRSESPAGLVRTPIIRPIPRDSDSVDQGQCPGAHVPNMLTGDADAAALRTTALGQFP